MSVDFSWVPEAPKTPEQIEQEKFFSSASFAGSMLLSNLTTARECVEKESNYIALMEFDHDVTEAIERLESLRVLAMERVSHLRNLSLLEVA